jgi:hypothetical protein
MAYYRNGYMSEVTGYTISFDSSVSAWSVSETQTVTVTYTEGGITKTTTLTVRLLDRNKTPNSITVTPPAKTTYIMDEHPDTTGMVVTVHYTDGSSRPTDFHGGYWPDLTLPGTKTVTVLYSDGSDSLIGNPPLTLTATFEITVIKRDLRETALSENVWTNGSLTPSNTPFSTYCEQWFSFPVIQGQTYYIWRIYPSDASYINLSLYYDNEYWTYVHDQSPYYHENSLGYTFTADQDGTVYVRAGYGAAITFQITYTTSDSRPSGGEKRVDSISVTPPSKTYYGVNELQSLAGLDLDGMVVTVHYTDNTQADVTNSGGFTIETYEDLTTPGYKPIWVNYSGVFGSAFANFGIEVYDTPTYGISLYDNNNSPLYYGFSFPSALEGYGAPTPLEVTVRNTGNQATGALTIALSGADSASFTLSTASIGGIAVGSTGSFSVRPNTSLPLGTYTATVTVSNGNSISESFDARFSVNPKYLLGIEVTALPIKTTYFAGETFDPTGLSVKANYLNADPAVITGYTLSPPDMSTPGEKYVTVSYTEGGYSTYFQITVTARAYGISLQNTGDPLSSHTFPAATLGYGAQTPLTVTVGNTGNQATGALNLTLSGTNSASFTLSPASSIGSIAVGNTGSFTVSPNTGLAAGTYTATVTVSGGNDIRKSFSVSFTVTSYGISLKNNGSALSSHTFPAATLGYAAQTPLTVTIGNTGNQATGTLNVALSGTNPGSFTLSPASSIGSIAVGNTGSFTVSPNTGLTAGTYTATVTVSGGNGISADFSVIFTVSAPTNGAVVTLYWVNEQGKLGFSNGASDTVSRTGTLVITAQDTGYTGQQWFINGVEEPAKAGQSSYTFSGVNREVGKKNVIGLLAVKNNKPYYAELTVIVTAQ